MNNKLKLLFTVLVSIFALNLDAQQRTELPPYDKEKLKSAKIG